MSDFENIKKLAGVDNVNHPQHYCREDAMECIEEMELVFGIEAVKHFCLCNAWKYRYRSADKNGSEDIAKSDWYIRKYKELCEKEEPITIKAKESEPNQITIPYVPSTPDWTPYNPNYPIVWYCSGQK